LWICKYICIEMQWKEEKRKDTRNLEWENINRGLEDKMRKERNGMCTRQSEIKKKEEREREKWVLASLMYRWSRDRPSHASTTHSLSLNLYMDDPSNCATRTLHFFIWRLSFRERGGRRRNRGGREKDPTSCFIMKSW